MINYDESTEKQREEEQIVSSFENEIDVKLLKIAKRVEKLRSISREYDLMYDDIDFNEILEQNLKDIL